MDTRIGGDTIDELFEQTGPVGPLSTTELTVVGRGGVPAENVGAVALNVTGVNATSNTFVTVWPTGQDKPDASNLNLRGGIPAIPNMVIVPVGLDGKISLFNNNGNTDLIVDVLGWFPATFAPSGTTRISVDSDEVETINGGSLAPAISPDGRYVAFASDATNLVTGDSNGLRDIFLRDHVDGTTIRVNVADDGSQATGGASEAPAISDNGRFVAYHSSATNLLGVGVDTNAQADVFLYDTVLETTTRVSITSAGAQAGGASMNPAISADGRFIVYESGANDIVVPDDFGTFELYLYDTVDETTIRVSVSTAGLQGNGASQMPSISDDGAFIAYHSTSTNLVLDDSNGQVDIFVYDRVNAETTRVSVRSTGEQGNSGSLNGSISGDGRFVVFDSAATDLLGPGNDTNAAYDVFRHDRTLEETIRISVDSFGAEATGNSFNYSLPKISFDGRYVAFQSRATNLVTGDGNSVTDVYLRDTLNGVTQRVTLDTLSGDSNSESLNPRISGNGRFVVFESDASDLVKGDNNSLKDVFLFDQGTI